MVLCPNCNKDPLYLTIHRNVTMVIKEIGLSDVIPGERVDEDGKKVLECLNCGWRGWIDDYHAVKNGVIKLLCHTEEGIDL